MATWKPRMWLTVLQLVWWAAPTRGTEGAPPAPPALPEGGQGIAARYPGARGI